MIFPLENFEEISGLRAILTEKGSGHSRSGRTPSAGPAKTAVIYLLTVAFLGLKVGSVD